MTTAVVVAVILGELALLIGVYLRAAPARTADLGWARLAGVADTLTVDSPQAARNAVARDLAALPLAGLSATERHRLDRAAGVVAGTHPSTAALSRLRSAVDASLAAAKRRQHRLDEQTIGIYVVLLMIASAGWFSWFRRVARRQRQLEKTVTEQRANLTMQRRLASIVEAARDVILIVDRDGRIDFASAAAEPVLGRNPKQLLRGGLGQLFGAGQAELVAEAVAGLTAGDARMIEIEMGTGTTARQLECHLQRPADSERDETVLTICDVTEQRAFEAALRQQAVEDHLTGLPNRRWFDDALHEALADLPAGTTTAVLICDVDEFKSVNDTLGHQAGDELLRCIGRRLQGVSAGRAQIARLGGDEFGLIVADADEASARRFARELVTAAAAPINVADTVQQIAVSVGLMIAVAGTDAETALRNADLALYQSKSTGQGRVSAFEPVLHDRAVAHVAMRRGLKAALGGGEFRLHWQPQLDVATELTVGFEALVRWQHPSGGLLLPGSFLPDAERAGLLVDLDRWVLGEACRQAVTLTAAADVHVSVNLSPHILDEDDLVDTVRTALARSGLDPSALVVEVTETSLMSDLPRLAAKLQAIKDLGAEVAVDDFGTGFSSLSYVHALPLDELKIDRSFVSRLGDGDSETAVLQTILDLAGRLGLRTVAEGVETPEQFAWLRDRGCHLAQGFLWARGIPLEDALDRLYAENRRQVPAPRHRQEPGTLAAAG